MQEEKQPKKGLGLEYREEEEIIIIEKRPKVFIMPPQSIPV